MSRHAAITDVFTAVADPTRRSLLAALASGEQPVGNLASRFQVTLPAVSQHLRLLRKAGLVSVRPAGRQRFYRLEPAPLKEVSEWVRSIERFWRQKLNTLGRHLEENP